MPPLIGFPDYYEPANVVQPTCVGTLDLIRGIQSGTLAGVAWPAGGLAFYIPFTLGGPVVVQGFFIPLGAVSGNVDVGVYDVNYNAIVRNGGLPRPGGTCTGIAFSNPSIGPGQFKIGISSDSNTLTVLSYSLIAGLNELLDITESVASYPLPSVGLPIYNDTRNYVPVVQLLVQSLGGVALT